MKQINNEISSEEKLEILINDFRQGWWRKIEKINDKICIRMKDGTGTIVQISNLELEELLERLKGV